jgi:hypothetical protein
MVVMIMQKIAENEGYLCNIIGKKISIVKRVARMKYCRDRNFMKMCHKISKNSVKTLKVENLKYKQVAFTLNNR